MDEFMSITVFLLTPADELCRLDNERRFAEDFCTDANKWANLAERYEAQGRPAQAASCRRRAEHYHQKEVIYEPV